MRYIEKNFIMFESNIYVIGILVFKNRFGGKNNEYE